MLKIRLQLTAATDPNPSRRRSAAAARKTTREAAMAAQASKQSQVVSTKSESTVILRHWQSQRSAQIGNKALLALAKVSL